MAFPIFEVNNPNVVSTWTKSITGASHIKAVDINVTDATTQSSGYNASFFFECTNTGAMSPTEYSGARFNLMLDTGTKGGAVINALKAKVGTNSAPTISSAVNGLMVSMDQVGTMSSQNCLWLEMYNTSNATSSSFIMCRAQGSSQQAALVWLLGTNRPTYLLKTQLATANGFLDRGTTGGDQCIGHLALDLGGTAGYINVFSDNS